MIEALVSIAVLLLGIVGALGAIGEMTRSEARMRDAELMRKLAHDKFDEVVATGELVNAPLDGTFEDLGHPELEWTLETEPNSQVPELLTIRMQVEHSERPETTSYRFATVRAAGVQGRGAQGP